MKCFRGLVWALPLAFLLANVPYPRVCPNSASAQLFESPDGGLPAVLEEYMQRQREYMQQEQQILQHQIERALKLIVMVGGQLAGSPTIGAGIIFGADKQNLYIVTANHVVRRGQDKAEDLHINLRSQPTTALEAELLDPVGMDLDLAVIRLPYRASAYENMDTCPPSFSRLGNVQLVKTFLPGGTPLFELVNIEMKRGDAVYPVGNPNGVAWGMPMTADRLSDISGHDLTFQSNFISHGHSGGALLSEAGGLLGMVTADSPPFGRAVDLIAVLQRLFQWGLPVALHVRGTDDQAVREGDVDELRRLITETGYCVGTSIRLNELLITGSDAARPEIVKLLLDAGADPNYKQGVALYWGAKAGSEEIVDLLLAKGVSPSGNSDALRAAADNGHESIAKRLLAAGFRSKSALYSAVEKDDIEMIRLFLSFGANTNEEKSLSSEGWTPLQLAACHGQLTAIQALLNAGANVRVIDRKGRTLLHLATVHGWLTRRNIGYIPDCYKYRKPMEIVPVLVQAGCAINNTDNYGWTPLHFAVVDDDINISFLLAHGADPNAQTKEGDTPMHIALYSHSSADETHFHVRQFDDDRLSKIVELLLRAGAKPDLENASSVSPRYLAEIAVPSKTRDEILRLMANGRKSG